MSIENKNINLKIAPRTPEKAEVLYRGVVMSLGHAALELLHTGQTILPPPTNGEQLYSGAAKGVYLSSDPETARIYADNRSFISQQRNPSATRDPSEWTIGVLNKIDNTGNQLDVKVAKPSNAIDRFDKFVSHYVLGRTEFVTPEVPLEKNEASEVYLFRGDILHATFSDADIAVSALAQHIKHQESGGLEGAFTQNQPDAKIDRKISTIYTENFFPEALKYVKSKTRHLKGDA